jgi:hypothetical protein
MFISATIENYYTCCGYKGLNASEHSDTYFELDAVILQKMYTATTLLHCGILDDVSVYCVRLLLFPLTVGQLF